MIERARIKQAARQTVRQGGNQSGMIGAGILYRVLVAGVWSAVLAAMSASGLLSWLLAALASGLGAAVIIQAPVDIGLKRYYLYLAQHGRRTRVGTIFDGFDCYLNVMRVRLAEWLRVDLIVGAASVVVGIITFISQLLTLLDGGLLGLLLGMVLGGGGLPWWLFLLLSAALWVLGSFLFARMWALRWILAEDPRMPAGQAVAQCLALTRGRVWDLMLYEWSFIGWRLLDLVTIGLASVLFVDPYYNMTSVLLYQEMKGAPVQLRPVAAGPDAPEGGQTAQIEALRGQIGRMQTQLALFQRQLGQGVGSDAYHNGQAALPGIYGVRGAYAGSTFVLEADRPMTLGRDPAAAQIVFGQAAGKVSGAHCTVTYVASEDRYRVVDLSSNGTYVGNSRLPARTPVLVNRGAELMLADADNVVRLL